MPARDEAVVVSILLGFVAAFVQPPVPFGSGDRDAAGLAGVVAATIIIGAVIFGSLWYFNHRRHGWPKWVLLAVCLGQLLDDFLGVHAPPVRLALDMTALAVLLWGWPWRTVRAESYFDRP
jgi:hypothetical protein